MRKLVLLGLLTLAACATAAAPDAMSAFTGSYTRQFSNRLVDGTRYQSEDRLDIARVDATHAAVSVGLEFYNGHSCSISGDATLANDALVLTAPAENDGLPRCMLHITHEGEAMVFRDPESGCLMHYCGARGSFEGARLPYSSRRPPPSVERVRQGSDEP
jgi:hypothetical protein